MPIAAMMRVEQLAGLADERLARGVLLTPRAPRR